MKNILVFDTETAGTLGQPLIYDFGYCIVSPNGEELVKRSTLITEIFDTVSLMEKAFYGSKVKDYIQKFENGEIEKMSFRNAIKQFVSDSKKYKVEIIGAYNLAFDIRALNTTLRVLCNDLFESKWLDKFFSQKNKKLLCIWNLACETILDSDEFRSFADENGFKSLKGNYLTNAEVAYNYVKDSNDFKEKHTALEDSEIEIEILLDILKDYTGIMTYGLHYGSWRKAQKKKSK